MVCSGESTGESQSKIFVGKYTLKSGSRDKKWWEMIECVRTGALRRRYLKKSFKGFKEKVFAFGGV